MLNLPYIDAPNPYYTGLKMKLYYEFMIEENLKKVKEWRNFKKQKNKQLLDEHRSAVRDMKRQAKEAKVMLEIEVELGRKGKRVDRT